MKPPVFTSAEIAIIGLIAHYGCLKVTLKVAARILGRCDDTVAAYLHDHGITVERNGKRKLVHLADIAKLAADKSDNVAAIRND